MVYFNCGVVMEFFTAETRRHKVGAEIKKYLAKFFHLVPNYQKVFVKSNSRLGT